MKNGSEEDRANKLREEREFWDRSVRLLLEKGTDWNQVVKVSDALLKARRSWFQE